MTAPDDEIKRLRTRCAECDCGDGDCTWIASGPAEEYEECICPAPCPIHHAPDAVARLAEAITPAPQPEGEPVTLTYTNWRGETAQRTLTPKRIWWGATDWHPEPQWLLTAFDAEKQADRDFALKDFGAATQQSSETVAEALTKAKTTLAAVGAYSGGMDYSRIVTAVGRIDAALRALKGSDQ